MYIKGSEEQELVAQRGSGLCIPGDIPGQAGQGSEQSGVAVGVSVHCRAAGPDDL